ncbi:MAG: hypothetical protein DHS20C11_24090 [Lysobacteraceae bacterium]|nr:MAG: hypothetical protein DHS20C11_24090 [Xanthomonadaceae bacterium]
MNVRNAWGIALAMALLSGCASSPSTQVDRAALLQERVNERWELLLAKEYFDAWEYLSPGAKSVVDATSYARRLSLTQVVWKNARFIDSKCESEDVCSVRISITVEVKTGMPMAGNVETSQVASEDWVWADRNWYYVPKP